MFLPNRSLKFNVFIEIITVSIDEIKETVFGSNEQIKAKTVETGMKVKTEHGR
jgi:hypothetical protein